MYGLYGLDLCGESSRWIKVVIYSEITETSSSSCYSLGHGELNDASGSSLAFLRDIFFAEICASLCPARGAQDSWIHPWVGRKNIVCLAIVVIITPYLVFHLLTLRTAPSTSFLLGSRVHLTPPTGAPLLILFYNLHRNFCRFLVATGCLMSRPGPR